MQTACPLHALALLYFTRQCYPRNFIIVDIKTNALSVSLQWMYASSTVTHSRSGSPVCPTTSKISFVRTEIHPKKLKLDAAFFTWRTVVCWFDKKAVDVWISSRIQKTPQTRVPFPFPFTSMPNPIFNRPPSSCSYIKQRFGVGLHPL